MKTNPPTEADERAGLPSASKALSLKLCPGSYRLSQQAPPSSSSPDAVEGELGHSYMEYLARKHLLGLGDSNAPQVSEDLLLVAESAWASVETLLQEFGGIAWKAKTQNWQTFIETRAWFTVQEGDVARKIFSGRCDLAIVDENNRMFLLDYKFGRGSVHPAEENLQLRALSAAMDSDRKASGLPQISELWAAIIQPRVGQPNGARYSREDLDKANAEIEMIFREALDNENAPRVPGYKQCQYCNAKPLCPEARQSVVELADIVPAAAEVTKETVAAIVQKLTNEQIGPMLAQCEVATLIIAATKSEALARAKQGEQIPGWSLKANSPTRTIENPQEAYNKLASLITATDFVSACKISVTALDGVFAGAKGCKKKEAKAQLAEALGTTLTLTEKNPSLVQN